MRVRTLRLFEDRVEGGARPIYLPRGDRAVYVRSGACHFDTLTTSQYLTDGLAYAGGGQLSIQVEAEPVVLWRWELAEDDDSDDAPHLLRSAPQATSELKLKADFPLDERFGWLLRCDTVTFPPGGVAWGHLHQGPGIRITRHGSIAIETEGRETTHGPGSPWAEKGVLPVVAPTTEEEETSFVRCFILPIQLKGVSSLRTISAEDRAKPNTQSYRVLADYFM